MDARIGILVKDGKEVFYAYVNGYGQEPVMGSLEQVEYALGLRASLPVVQAPKLESYKTYNVLMNFEFPSWSTVDGITYNGIMARSKSDAVKQARKMAEDDGHAVGGVGRYWFKATEQKND